MFGRKGTDEIVLQEFGFGQAAEIVGVADPFAESGAHGRDAVPVGIGPDEIVEFKPIGACDIDRLAEGAKQIPHVCNCDGCVTAIVLTMFAK